MDFNTILKPECCLVELKASGKDEVLRKLAEQAVKDPAAAALGKEFIYEKLKERESQGSTAFEDGIALPHARMKELDDFIVFITVSSSGVDFNSLDNKKTRLIFTILGPEEKVQEHLKILAAVSHTISKASARNELIKAPSSTALYESFLRTASVSASSTVSKRKMKLFIIILYLDELLYDLMEFFIQEGIDGATILDSSGMGEFISNVPLFASFIGFMQERKNYSKTIIALIPAERETSIIEGIEAITGDLDTKQGAMIMSLDVSFHKGTMKMM
jgi:nitrogen PTS system EIIA component